MTDLHDAFAAWLLRGARDELPRDAALHASACTACLQATGALDALTAIDPGLAQMPPIRVVAATGARRGGLLPATVTVAVIVLVVAAGFVAGGTFFRAGPDPDVAAPTRTPGGAVLGGQGGPAESETNSPSVSPTASATASPTPSPTTTPAPTTFIEPPPPGPPAPVPAPTPPPTPRPTGTAKPASTPPPTPTPGITLTPTPTPVADDCENGIDDDGDLLIDNADPGCLLDGNEASL